MENTFKYRVEVGPHNNLKFLCQTDDCTELIDNVKIYTNSKIGRSYYWRVLDFDTYVWIDYGSWDDFVYIYFLNEEAKKKFMETKIEL
jgi:hypothetical protein